MSIILNHVNITVQPDQLEQARKFYVEMFGFLEIPRPAILKSKGVWFQVGNQELHILLENNLYRKKTIAHVAYEVDNLDELLKKLSDAGVKSQVSLTLNNYRRYKLADPFGNKVELMEKIKKSI